MGGRETWIRIMGGREVVEVEDRKRGWKVRKRVEAGGVQCNGGGQVEWGGGGGGRWRCERGGRGWVEGLGGVGKNGGWEGRRWKGKGE